jgi:antitoxin VapB
MSIKAKLFMSGRSQAIRWPAKLRIHASEVRIERFGQGFLLQPEPSPHLDRGEWLREFYASTEPMPENFLTDREDTAPQQRDWD